MQPLRDLEIGPLPADLTRVEAVLEAGVRSPNAFLGEVAAHLLRAGGKRLRPALTLCVWYAAKGADGGASEEAVTGACSVELVHLGSLYHDDVIDAAETRRGVPSVNARWSNIVAILAGDYLLARASEYAASLGADVAGLLASTITELCRGQVLELQHLFDVERTEDAYFSAIAGKTAALMSSSCRIGGMVGAVPPPTLDALGDFGHHLGMCFQVIDDVLDVTRTDAELGKPAGNDVLAGVYTLPVIRALEGSEELRERLGRSLDPGDAAHVRSLIATPAVVEASMATARDHAERAVHALDRAEGLDERVCERLRALVTGLVTRTS